MNWLTPLARARESGPKGSGSFAVAPIPAGTTVAAFGGFVAERDVMESLPLDRQNRSIQIDDELTFDYAMSDGTDYDEFECHCGSTLCRGIVRGRDWRLPEVQHRYAGSFSPYLAARIAVAQA